MKTFFYILLGILVGLLAAGVIWLATSNPRGEPVTLLPSPTPGNLAIYVSGAVATPGLYYLPEGSRVADAITAAGGFILNAQVDQVNLAAPLTDGLQVKVPALGGNNTISLRININTATAAELETLPEIGSTTAQAIIDYRTQYGPFLHIQDIAEVPGIGSATYNAIKDLITVGP
jgi:competence protein ComEA